ncbi:MAG: tetratricopeptide repeat protein, partial [Ekhidna sp.]|nr:tetratricopeptide repeat protein [Ekhidna sp.]
MSCHFVFQFLPLKFEGMIRLLGFIVFGFSSIFCVASDRLDSLKYELFNHAYEDVRKVELLNELGFENWIINPVQSIIYGQQAKALSEVIDDTLGLAFSNRVIGVAHWARGSYDKGLGYLLDGLSLYKSLKDTLGEANCLMNIGLIYSDRLDNDLALEYYFEALKLFEMLNAKDRAATTYTKVATVFIRKRDFSAAYDFLGRATLIHRRNGFEYGILKTQTKEYDSAKIYLNRSLKVSLEIEDLDGIARNYINLADLAILLNRLDEAENLLQDALLNAKKVQSNKWLKEVYD